MSFISPVGQYGPRRGKELDEFHERHGAYFAQCRPSIKTAITINWFATGYTAAEIHRGTGFALDFIHNVAQRFAYKCLLRFIDGQYIGEPPKDKRKREQFYKEKKRNG